MAYDSGYRAAMNDVAHVLLNSSDKEEAVRGFSRLRHLSEEFMDGAKEAIETFELVDAELTKKEESNKDKEPSKKKDDK